MVEQIIHITNPSDVEPIRFAEGLSSLDPASWTRHRPDTHLLLVRDGICVGRCSVWTTETPRLNDTPVGVVGHYAAINAMAGAALLRHVDSVVAQSGLSKIVGPMDGNTWRRYRFITRRGDQPFFFLEPDNPDDWPGHFEAAGFTPLSTYTSALNEDLTVTDPRVPPALKRLEAEGVRIRSIDLAHYERELIAVHELSIAAFSENFLYTPIGPEEFVATYAPLKKFIRPELVLLAERDGKLVGFMFGMPDVLEAQCGLPPTTAIAKSMAVRPGRTGAGLGSVLMDLFQQAARQAGFRRVIHALMHEQNRSVNISGRFGKPMRHYTLFAKVVTS